MVSNTTKEVVINVVRSAATPTRHSRTAVAIDEAENESSTMSADCTRRSRGHTAGSAWPSRHQILRSLGSMGWARSSLRS